MILTIIDEKKVYIHVKMEQVFLTIRDGHGEAKESEDSYLLIDYTTPQLLAEAENMLSNDEYLDYEWILDFRGIKYIHSNLLLMLQKSFVRVKVKKVCNIESLTDSDAKKLKDVGFITDETESYQEGLSKVCFSFIVENCLEEEIVYDTGEVIHNYINLRKLLEENSLYFSVCYVLAEKIWEVYKHTLNKYVLFCHTLNGACIAETLSVLLRCDVLYADSLTSKGKMRRNYMPKRFLKEKKSIVVTDVVCQGHELIRAQDIINMMGGTTNDCVGVVRIHIPGVKSKLENENFIVLVDEDMQAKIKYSLSFGGGAS